VSAALPHLTAHTIASADRVVYLLSSGCLTGARFEERLG